MMPPARTATVPAMPNAHSHAFQRDLRGLVERPGPAGEDFWSWREAMMAEAGRLDPGSMRAVAARTYAEMRAAGYGAVGEFHYVHHRPDGTPYEDPNTMAHAVGEAAGSAGLEIVLLPAAYHRGGAPRFADPDVESFLVRVDALREWAQRRAGVSVGVAAHSIRAVPVAWLGELAAYADRHGLVRHVHAAEQTREVEACLAEHGKTPIELLYDAGFLGPRTSVIHAIHVTDRDVALLAETDSIVVSCPTTEGNLGDGVFPALRYRDAGVRIAIGSDQHVRIDPFEEARELETLARRERHTRNALLRTDGDLWGRLVRNGLDSLGLSDAPDLLVDRDHPDLRGVADQDLRFALVTSASASVVVPG